MGRDAHDLPGGGGVRGQGAAPDEPWVTSFLADRVHHVPLDDLPSG